MIEATLENGDCGRPPLPHWLKGGAGVDFKRFARRRGAENAGVLNIPEEEFVAYFHGGFASTYTRNRIIDSRSGNVVRDDVRKNHNAPQSDSKPR
jgi:hypothetical protein